MFLRVPCVPQEQPVQSSIGRLTEPAVALASQVLHVCHKSDRDKYIRGLSLNSGFTDALCGMK